MSQLNSKLADGIWEVLQEKSAAIRRDSMRYSAVSEVFAEFIECRAFDQLMHHAEECDLVEDFLSKTKVRFLVNNARRMESVRLHQSFEPDDMQLTGVLPLRDRELATIDTTRLSLPEAINALSILGVRKSEVADWCQITPSHLSRIGKLKKKPSKSLSYALKKHLTLRLYFHLGRPDEAVMPRFSTKRSHVLLRAHSEMVELKESKINDVGVYALCDFAPGEFIGEITGTRHSDPNYDSNYCFETQSGWKLEPEDPFRRLNHSCAPNATYWDFTNEDATQGDSMFWVEATEHIKRGEEITIDYGEASSQRVRCHCGTDQCRNWIVAAGDGLD